MVQTRELNRVYKNAHPIHINTGSKLVFFSDVHRGDGSAFDDFAKNSQLYLTALNYYYKKGYTYIEVGDGDELWENRHFEVISETHPEVFELFSKFNNLNRIHMVVGNHDLEKLSSSFKNKLPKELGSMVMREGIKLLRPGKSNEILVVHGHQDDLFNDYLSGFTKFIVRYIAKPLQILFCFRNPLSPAVNSRLKNAVENRMAGWIKEKGCPIIAGHTHRPCFPVEKSVPYLNCGSCVKNNLITCIEINGNNISLIKWCIKSQENGTLYAARKNLTGEKRIDGLFDFNFP